MKEIHLTQGKIALVDDEDFEFLNQWKWCAVNHSGIFYAARRSKRDIVTKKQKEILMHREIMNAVQGEIIDHKKGDGLNNQKSNLRKCTYSGNSQNRQSAKNSTSKYLGVSQNINRNNFRAQITSNSQTYYLGYFKTQEQAALAYNEAAKKYHGEFARLNEVNCS